VRCRARAQRVMCVFRLKGKMVTVRLQKPGDVTVTNVEHCPAHERLTVRRAPAAADPGPSPR
jgi:hypothetical protein